MKTYDRCNPSFIVTSKQIRIIQEMYPYRTYRYSELAMLTDEYLKAWCMEFPKDTKVLALSQHNGRGHLWSIILLQYPFWKEEWQIFAHYGHYSPLWVLIQPSLGITKKYFQFIEHGKLPKPVHKYGKRPLPETMMLNDLLA